MLSKLFVFRALAIFSTLFAVFSSGCDESIEFSNTPPGSLSISRDINYIGAGEVIGFTGSATDANGDSVTYWWTAEAGEFVPADGKGREVLWTAPPTHGIYRMTLHVSDGIDESKKGEDLTVGIRVVSITGDEVYNDKDFPYVVVSDGYAMVGFGTLTFGPGVTVVFNSQDAGIFVKNEFTIAGTEDERVSFIPNRFPGDEKVWGGLLFNGPLSESSINYATFSGMLDGLVIENDAVVVADNILVDNTSHAAVTVRDNGDLTLTNSRLWDNSSGMLVDDGKVSVTGSSIRYNSVYAFTMIATVSGGDFYAVIRDCVIANNAGLGISLSGYAAPRVNNCSIFLNGPYGVPGKTLVLNPATYLGTERIDVTGNYWGVDNAEDIEEQIDTGGLTVEIDYSGWLTEPPVGE